MIKTLITTVFILLSFSLFAQNSPVTHLSQQAALTKLQSAGDKFVLIDVRTSREYQNGRIPNAINIPHQQILNNVNLLDKYKDKDIIFYCHSGVRVKKVTDRLAENNLELFHIKGDYRAWRAQSLPIASD